MSTITSKVLALVSKQGTITRKQLQFNIFKAQGKTGKEAKTYRQGYYCDGIQKWVRTGLLVQPKEGHFKLGTMGKKYLDDPRLANALIRVKNLEKRNENLRNYTDKLSAKLHKYHEIEKIVNR